MSLQKTPVERSNFELRMHALREEQVVSGYRAKYVTGRLAISVQGEKVTPRDFMNKVHANLVAIDASMPNDAAFILSLTMESYLETRRGEKRPSDLRWASAKDRTARAMRRLGERHPEVRRLRELEVIARANVPEERTAAIAVFRSLLKDRGYPSLDFLTSLRAVALAKMLRDSKDDSLREEERQLLDKNLQFRTNRYGAEHPFTLVAHAHRVLFDLVYLERILDRRPLSGAELKAARALLSSTDRLLDLRGQVFGEKHDSVIQAMGYNARAHRLLNQRTDALNLANRALSRLVEDRAVDKDKFAPAFLRVVVADALVWKVTEARRQLDNLANTLHSSTSTEAHDRAKQLKSLELERARRNASEALRLTGEALKIMAHMRAAGPEVWMSRARALQATLHRKGYGDLSADTATPD